MNLNYDELYARDKFWAAHDVLTAGTDDIRERLHEAFMSFHPVRAQYFEDAENAELFRSIVERLTSVRDGDPERGYLENTLAGMDCATARGIAGDIVALYERLARKAAGNGERAREAGRVPIFRGGVSAAADLRDADAEAAE